MNTATSKARSTKRKPSRTSHLRKLEAAYNYVQAVHSDLEAMGIPSEAELPQELRETALQISKTWHLLNKTSY